MTTPRGTALVGHSVKKYFLVPNNTKKRRRKLYNGEVTGYDSERQLYHVVYEDDDEEEMEWKDLQKIILDDGDGGRRTLTHVVTPGSNDGDSDYEEEDNDSSTEDEQDEDLLEGKKPPARRKTPTSNKKLKRAPTTRTKTVLFSSSSSSKCSPRSIAARGLPQGSRAVGRGGFEVRSLDGISPLLTTESVGKAIKLVAAGQHQAAARLLQTPEHDSIRAFCKAACKKLGMDIPGGLALEGGSELSDRARARLHEGTVNWDADLPGRLLVVRAGTALSDDNDNNNNNKTSEPLCPPHVVDCVFASAAELHTHTKARLATYAMDATRDAAFGPWNVMIQRLHSAGLLPGESADNNDDDNDDAYPKRPFVVTIEWNGGDDLPVGSWQMYRHNMLEDSSAVVAANNDKEQVQWALIEGATRDAPPVILGVSPNLIADVETDGNNGNDDDDDDERYEMNNEMLNADCGLLPSLSSAIAQVRLPASLLQKAIRRNFCSAAPLLEACSWLLHGENLGSGKPQNKPKGPPRGGVFEMLKTTWRCMLEDASPFDAPDDGSLLGFEELLLLSLVAIADPSWKMPQLLCRKAVAAAIRTQKQPANFANIEKTLDSTEVSWRLQEVEPSHGQDVRSVKLQNALLVMRAAIGGKIVHRSSLEKTAPIEEGEATLVDRFEEGVALTLSEPRLEQLDNECRLAAYDPQVAPAGLLLLQATLSEPPVAWKKHSLPSLAKQVYKLVTEANARLPDHHRLTRLAAWGNNNTSTMASIIDQKAETSQKLYSSAREIVTSTGKLSDKEHEIVDCFEAVQRWREEQKKPKQQKVPTSNLVVGSTKNGSAKEENFLRAEVGAAPREHDGRIAFLLAFAKAEEIEVHPEGGKAEVVNVLFCGDSEEPLLVQRIGKARKEAAATLEGPESGSSGAKAVPSLGYVQRSRSKNDRLLVEAAEQAVAQSWKDGRIVSLPLPPPGFQWNLTKSTLGQEEQAERAVQLTATLSNAGVWQFTIGGIRVEPFDARKVISPCSLDTQNHKPFALGPERERLLQIALYVDDDRSSPDVVLRTVARLHELAVDARQHSPNEGHVYDWLPMATAGRITCTIWRDAILALKTREKDDLVLGPVLADGTCKRDMTEGCLFRIFNVLESLYPTALIKGAALKWRVRPRGAQYHHMLVCLEQLSRGLVPAPVAEKKLSTVKRASSNGASKPQGSRKRPQRRAAAACKEKVASLASGDDSMDVDAAYEVALEGDEEEEFLPLPKVTTELWPHQEASVAKVVAGIKEGRRGHADASAVGAGKTLTALATIVRLTAYMEERHGKRNGVLVMLPTKALVKEWLLQIAEHTSGFHVVEQREDGQLFSLTYGKSTPPIDGNTIVISTLDRVREHPFTRQAAWDFVIIDECLAIQNAAAKRCPSAWRQIEVSTLGVLMLSATFFRSKYSDLFYMIRMLRTPFPRSMEWLSAMINEHIVCQVPETDRTWQMRGEPVPLPPVDLAQYRKIIEAYKRKQLNNLGEAQDFRRLFIDLEAFLRRKYEGRESRTSYSQTSVMAEACFKACDSLLKQGRRPLVFADTSQEAEHLLGVLCAHGLNARTWANVARENVSGRAMKPKKQSVIVAVKSVEGQGINMQSHADAIVCRPTPGDHLEQMKGRIDRPGQNSKKLILVVLMAEHTIEEAKFANIHLAGNFFREYIAPVATRYRERIDLEATLAAGGTTKLKRGTVSGAWRRSLEAAGQSGAFARIDGSVSTSPDPEDTGESEECKVKKRARSNDGKAVAVRASNKARKATASTGEAMGQDDSSEPKFAPLNKVLRNKGDPEAVRQAKRLAKNGRASLAVRRWLFPPKERRSNGLAKESLMRFSDATPPLVLDHETVHKAVAHLSKDTKLAALISRVGAQALIQDCGEPKSPTQAKLFNYCVRAMTFTMVSVDAGNAFLRRLAIKIGVCVENMKPEKRLALLKETLKQMQEGETSEYDHLTTDDLLNLLLAGKSYDLLFTPGLLGALVETCLVLNGKQSGYPHLCGVTYRCGKQDNHQIFLQKAREHAAGGNVPVSAGFSASKASFLISMVHDFECGKITAEKIAKASDREAAKMLIGLRGIGDWCAGGILMHFLKRANIMLYGDLTIRNYLNDLYEINHNDGSETMLESAADFPDTGKNRNLIDAVATSRGWEPYRTVVCLLMYHLQEENLVLL